MRNQGNSTRASRAPTRCMLATVDSVFTAPRSGSNQPSGLAQKQPSHGRADGVAFMPDTGTARVTAARPRSGCDILRPPRVRASLDRLTSDRWAVPFVADRQGKPSRWASVSNSAARESMVSMLGARAMVWQPLAPGR